MEEADKAYKEYRSNYETESRQRPTLMLLETYKYQPYFMKRMSINRQLRNKLVTNKMKKNHYNIFTYINEEYLL